MDTVNTTDQPIAPAGAGMPPTVAGLRRWQDRYLVVAPGGADFLLFILINGVLFIRPMDIVASLGNWPIYGILFFVCLLFSFRAVVEQLTARSLQASPITACVVGLLVAVLLSQLVHLNWSGALGSGQEFAKVVLYYLLLVAVVNTPRRLRWFLGSVAVFACIHITMAVLQHRGVIDLPAMRPVEEQAMAKTNGEIITQYRMCGAGLFHDPNDLAVLAAMTMVLCLHPLIDFSNQRGTGRWVRGLLALSAIGLSGYGLMLTQSRGGFIALLAGMAMFFLFRFGWRKSVLLAAIALPVLIVLFSGRQTDIHMMRRTTAQLRMGFWVQGLELFIKSPVFGIGQGNFLHMVGNVAHNSFLHCFTELGFFGGTFFLGAFYLALWPMIRFLPERDGSDDGHFELYSLRPYILGMLTAWVVGMLSLSRSYVPPTYMMLGLATVYLELAGKEHSMPRLCFDGRLAMRLLALGTAFLVGVYIFVKAFHKG